jgi:hypothetical protein
VFEVASSLQCLADTSVVAEEVDLPMVEVGLFIGALNTEEEQVDAFVECLEAS